MGFSDVLAAADRVILDSKLGDAVTYTPGVGDAVTVQGFFDAAYQVAEFDQAGVSTSSPACFLLLEDLPTDPETDTAATLTVAGVDYVITTPKKDGMGGILCLLHKA